jgi:hypothetical protein
MSQLVQTRLDRGPIQPAFRILAFGFAAHRPPQADLDGEFLGSRGIPYYLRDHLSQARIMGAKDPLDIRPGIVRFGSDDR